MWRKRSTFEETELKRLYLRYSLFEKCRQDENLATFFLI